MARGPLRCFCIGFSVASLTLFVGMAFPAKDQTSELNLALNQVAGYMADSLPFQDDKKLAFQYLVDWNKSPDRSLLQISEFARDGQGTYYAKGVWTHADGHTGNTTHTLPENLAGDAPSRESRSAVVRQHLILLFSLLGGWLGLWFWKREHRDEAAGENSEANCQ